MSRLIPAIVLVCLCTCVSRAAQTADAANLPYGVFGRPTTQAAGVAVHASALSPFILIRSDGPRVQLFQGLEPYGLSGPSHVAYVDNHNVRIAPTRAPIDPSTMTESWMLFLFHSSKGWDKLSMTPYAIDVPIFVVLQKAPSEIKPANGGIELTFPAEAGTIALMPFFGTSFIRAAETAGWKEALPQDIFVRCRLLAEISREFPIKVEEQFKVFPSQDRVVVRNRFDFLSIDDDWKTGHRKMAPLEHTVALAHRYKFRLLSVAGQVVDLDTPVGSGLWAGIEADECSYTLTGLLRYINNVEQPKTISPDHPLLDNARKNFDWQMAVPSGESLPNALARATALAAYLPYADPATRQSLHQSFRRVADLLLTPVRAPLQPDPLIARRIPGDIFRGLHDMTAATQDLSLIQARWSLLREHYRACTEHARWGDARVVADRNGDLDSALACSVCMARMAYWVGDDDTYRQASYHAAKQFLALWAVSTAYPKWVRERNLWASVTQGLEVHEENGSMVVNDATGPAGQTITLEDVPFSDSRGGNLGFCPGPLQGFHRPCDAERRFIKDRMPEHARYYLDTFAKKHTPGFHRAAYLEASRLPEGVPSPPLKSLVQPLLEPRLDDWDFYFDVPLAQCSERRQRFWQNNGGIKGHEFEIILAGIDQKYVSLWQGSTPPRADAAFRESADSAATSRVFFITESLESGSMDIFWRALMTPQRPKAELPPVLPLCGVRTH